MPNLIHLPGGNVLELEQGCATHGPGSCRGKGQHTNGPGIVWYRIDSGVWKRTGFRSLHAATTWGRACETLVDVEEVLGK